MNLDRPTLKARAKEIIRTAQPRVLNASLMMMALFALCSYLSSRLVGISAETAARYLSYVESGDAVGALNYLSARTPGPGAQLISYLLDAVQMIVSLGFLIFLLNTLRGTAAVYGNLLDGFGYWWKVLILNLVVGLLVVLWSLLLLIPGVVAAYRYSMAQYLLITRPELGIMDCIRESKRLTRGHKAELFVLDLSFLGWMLLCAVPVLGWLLSVWVTPYRSLTREAVRLFQEWHGLNANGVADVIAEVQSQIEAWEAAK